MDNSKKIVSLEDLVRQMLQQYMKELDSEDTVSFKDKVYIDTTTLKWGGEYDGGDYKTTHVRVKVNSTIVTYDYKNLKELIKVLKLLSNIEIIYNGEKLI